MKSATIFLVVGGIFILAFSSLVYAGVPQMINYQGKITDPQGALVDTTIQMVFTIYDAATDGGVLWTETQPSVVVEKGIFSVLLGSVTLIPDPVFTGATRYLGVKVGADPEMSPRKKIVSVAYAYKSEYADTAEYAQVAVSDGDWTISGSDMYSAVSGSVGVGTSSPETKLHVQDGALTVKSGVVVATAEGGKLRLGSDAFLEYIPQDGLNRLLSIGAGAWGSKIQFRVRDTGGNYHEVFIDREGDVGIGTTSPGYKLEVNGNFYANTVNTGYGNNELYAMNQNVRTTDNPTFNRLYLNDYGTALGGFHVGGSSDPGTDNLIVDGSAGIGVTPADKLDVNGDVRVRGADLKDAGGTARITLTDNGRLDLNEDGGSVSLSIATDGDVGIGTTSPTTGAKLHVEHNHYYAGYFRSNYLSSSTHVIHSEFTGSGNYDAKAVYGKSTPADNYGYGGYFEGGYYGVYGRNSATGDATYHGVYGTVSGGSGYNYGVRGYAYGTGYNYGVYGYAGGGTTNYAGYFNGNVRIVGTISKGGGSFQIDHPLDPENKYLFHSFVESPDMMNVYNGNVILDANGGAVIQLPDYFEALNRDFRYQLTCIGGFAPVYIAQEISGNQFTIAGGEAGMKVSWQVTGIRHDKFAEANRIQVEVDKPAAERGKYLHPEAYKLGIEYDIHYEEMKREQEKEKMMLESEQMESR